MEQLPAARRYSATAKALHWGIAALILIDFVLAVSFSQFNPGDALYLPLAYSMHMSFGMPVLMLSVPFVIRRLAFGYPRPSDDAGAPSRALARVVHELLYVFMVVVPVTGWVILSVRKRPATLLGSVDWPNVPILAGLPREPRAQLHDLFLPAHRMLAYIGMILVGLHFLAALHHHFYRRDGVLKRMLPQIPRRVPHLWRRSNDGSDSK
jgi:cytochrome b561